MTRHLSPEMAVAVLAAGLTVMLIGAGWWLSMLGLVLPATVAALLVLHLAVSVLTRPRPYVLARRCRVVAAGGFSRLPPAAHPKLPLGRAPALRVWVVPPAAASPGVARGQVRPVRPPMHNQGPAPAARPCIDLGVSPVSIGANSPVAIAAGVFGPAVATAGGTPNHLVRAR